MDFERTQGGDKAMHPRAANAKTTGTFQIHRQNIDIRIFLWENQEYGDYSTHDGATPPPEWQSCPSKAEIHSKPQESKFLCWVPA